MKYIGVNKLYRNIYMLIPVKAHGSNSMIHHLLLLFFFSYKLQVFFFYIYKLLNKNQNNINIKIIGNSNIGIHKIKFYWNIASSLSYELFMTAFTL